MSRVRPAKPGDRKGCVLIVDDELEVVQLARRCLELDGYSNVLCVTDPLPAADIARTERPDVVLLDASMPGVSGIDVLRALRTESATAGIPVVLLYTVNDTRAKGVAAEMGVREFLAKPFDPLELLARTRDALLIGALSRSAASHAA